MNITDKLRTYLINLDFEFEEIDEYTFFINDENKGLQACVVTIAEPLVIIRQKVMDVPSNNKEAFFRKLLTLNANDMVHGAYAIEENDVILTDSLEVETLDIEELQASLDSFGLAIAQHHAVLLDMR